MGELCWLFCDVITYLKERYQVTVLIPCKGDFSEWLEKNKIEYIILKKSSVCS